MIDLYTASTPNGWKASITLEELALPYEVHAIELQKNQQKEPAFLALNPNGRIPAIVDRDTDGSPVSVFESGAILIYLAEKTGKFLGPRGEQRAKTLEWLMWQMGGVGPMLGQANHFLNTAPEKIPYAIDRYITESARLIKVLDTRLGEADYMGGDYSIADMATYPWLAVAFELIQQAKPDVAGEGTNVTRWLQAVSKRPAVERGMAVPKV